MSDLLTRDIFREKVFARDGRKCIVCETHSSEIIRLGNGLSAHHIIERRLWDDGGYYLDNGASLCDPCHIKAESTEYSCDFIREKAGIKKIVLPDGWYADTEYTKWGDVILPNGLRMKGPLFNDDSVQKILKRGPYFSDYTDYVKYPRTYHLPWSESKTKDDRTLPNCLNFSGHNVVVTEKMDGENTTIYRDYIHARSIDGRNHWSRSWVKNLQAQIGYEIPEGWRICGENLYAKHSIGYENLGSFFHVFSIWDEFNQCLSWSDTVKYCDILGLKTVPVLYEGPWNPNLIIGLYDDSKREKSEGYVVRIEEGFSYINFKNCVAKFVRKNHVNQANHHWMFTATETNLQ